MYKFQTKLYSGSGYPCYECKFADTCNRIYEITRGGYVFPYMQEDFYRTILECKSDNGRYCITMKWVEEKEKNKEIQRTKYTLTNHAGNEIFSSDSFLGFIASIIITSFGAMLVIALIGLVISSVASLFS